MRKLALFYTLLAAAAFAAGFFLFKSKGTAPASERAHSVCPISEEAAARAYPANQDKVSARAMIVNHHLLAMELIAANLNRVATADPITVVIVSPNHFGAGSGAIIASNEDWDTCYGKIGADRHLTAILKGNNLVSVEEKPFDSEHGIYNLLPFIKHSFPNAKIVPLIVKESADDKLLSDLSKALASEVGSGGLVIGSFDFSHEVASDQADRQDRQSIEAIQSGNPADAVRATIDSRKGLRLVMEYANAAGAGEFVLTGNTNAAKLLQKPEMTDVTSYVTGYFP
ncbi:MAG: AmmeMemoRadiSam system protein B [Candidatus Saccharibacteria bacterium]